MKKTTDRTDRHEGRGGHALKNQGFFAQEETEARKGGSDGLSFGCGRARCRERASRRSTWGMKKTTDRTDGMAVRKTRISRIGTKVEGKVDSERGVPQGS